MEFNEKEKKIREELLNKITKSALSQLSTSRLKDIVHFIEMNEKKQY